MMAVRRRGFISGSPPLRAAIMISLMMRVNILPRFASVAAFLCLMVAHLEWPDIIHQNIIRTKRYTDLVQVANESR